MFWGRNEIKDEVKFPQKATGDSFKDMGFNKAIYEFRKLNEGWWK